jgi:MoaA/NifB/PqqE/SkfB family radical SAM enzyme
MKIIPNHCHYFNNAICIEPDTTEAFSYKPCCNFKSHLLEGSHTKYFKVSTNEINSATKYWDEQRLDKTFNYANLKETACLKCYRDDQVEDLEKAPSQLAMRKTVAQKFTPTKPGELNFLDISFSSFCNLACRYCTPSVSSSWVKTLQDAYQQNIDLSEAIASDLIQSEMDHKAELKQTIKQEKKILEDLKKLDLSHLQEVYIKGGEPMMARVLEEFLDLLIAQGCESTVSLCFNTNGGVFPKLSLLQKILRFKKVILRISIDAAGDLGGYIRQNLEWKMLEENLKKWKDATKEKNNLEVKIQITTNIYSVNKLIDIDKWAHKNNLDIIPGQIFGPPIWNFHKVLPVKYYDLLSERYNNKLHNPWLDNWQKLAIDKSRSEFDIKILEKFKRVNNKLDTVYQDSFEKHNPEMYHWLYSY